MDKLAVFVQLTEQKPHDPHIRYLLAQEYLKHNETEKALKELQIANQMDIDATFSTLLHDEIEALQATLPEKSDHKNHAVPFTILTGGKVATPIAPATTSFDQVIGCSELKKILQMRFHASYASTYQRFGLRPSNGFILYGPAGCGKSYIMHAASHEFHVPLVEISINDVLDPYYGQGPKNLSDRFDEAKSHSSAIILLHDIDTFAYHRAKSSYELRLLVDQLFVELDRLQPEQQNILVVGLSEMPWDIDPATRQYGRLDKSYFIPPPIKKEREEAFRLFLKEKPLDLSLDYDQLSTASIYFSYADIQSCIVSSIESILNPTMFFSHSESVYIQTQDILTAIKHHPSSAYDWLTNITNYVRFANQNGTYNDVQDYLLHYTDLLPSSNT